MKIFALFILLFLLSTKSITKIVDFKMIENKNLQEKYYTYYSDKNFHIGLPTFLQKSTTQNRIDEQFTNISGDITLSLRTTDISGFNLKDYFGDEAWHWKINYRVLKDNWYVVSGVSSDGKSTIYIKSYLSPKFNKQMRTMYLTYPTNRQPEFSSIIPYMLKTFKDN